jgi:hypothetical protein
LQILYDTLHYLELLGSHGLWYLFDIHGAALFADPVYLVELILLVYNDVAPVKQVTLIHLLGACIEIGVSEGVLADADPATSIHSLLKSGL